MDNQNLFSQSYNQILASVAGTGNKNFQMLGNPIDFSWPVAPIGEMSPIAYQLMSAMPEYSLVGCYSAGDARVFDSYCRVMSHITYKVSPEKQNDLQKLKDQYTKANNDLQTITTNMNSAYQVAKQNGGAVFTAMYPDIAAWLAGPGSTYKNDIEKQTQLVKQYQDQYVSLAADICIDQKLKEDFDIIKTPTAPISGPAPKGWTKVPNSDGVLEWQPVFNIGTTGQDWRAKLSSGSIGAFKVQLNASKSDSNFDQKWAGGSAGYDAFFWGVHGSGGWKRTNITESDQSVTAEIEVKSSTWVPVTPGSWYDGGLMTDLANNKDGYGAKITQPWVANGGPGSQSIFGQYGILKTRITGFVVAYKPSYNIDMQSSTYSKFEQEIQAGGGLRIGPFTFGGHGGSHKIEVHQTGNRTQLSGGSTSDDPLIIGMTVAFPGVAEEFIKGQKEEAKSYV